MHRQKYLLGGGGGGGGGSPKTGEIAQFVFTTIHCVHWFLLWGGGGRSQDFPSSVPIPDAYVIDIRQHYYPGAWTLILATAACNSFEVKHHHCA